MTTKSESQPLPKVELNLPLSFWSQVIITLDRKIHSMGEIYGFGSVAMKLVIRNGVVKDIVFNDEVKLRQKNIGVGNLPLDKNKKAVLV